MLCFSAPTALVATNDWLCREVHQTDVIWTIHVCLQPHPRITPAFGPELLNVGRRPITIRGVRGTCASHE
jgi:hypothetical protein